MNRKTIVQSLLCFAAVLALLFSGSALAEEGGEIVLAVPHATLVNGDTVQRGELLPVHLDEVQDAQYYYAQIVSGDGEMLRGCRSSDPGTLYAVTAPFEAGTYTLRCFVLNGNVQSDFWETPITITEYAGNEEIVLRCSKTATKPNEYTQYSVYAPGAVHIGIVCDEMPDLDWQSWSDSWAYNICLEPGEKHIHADAYYSDGRIVSSDTVTINFASVAGPSGKIGALTLKLEDGAVPAGQNVKVLYSFAANTDMDGVEVVYGWTLYDEADESGNWIYDTEELPRRGSFTIPGKYLEADHAYIVQVYAYAKSGDYASQSKEIRLYAAREADDRISLTVDGKKEITVGTHTDVTLNIHAPGATAIHLYKGREGDWDYWGERRGYHEDIEWNWNHWTNETVELYIEACFDPDFDDPNVEWVYSEPLVVHVTADSGVLSAPVITVPGDVAIGDMLAVSVDDLDENAEWCWADIHALRDNGEIDWDEQLAHNDMMADGNIYLNTARLEPGRTYVVTCGCSAPNWRDSNSAIRIFTASGSTDNAKAFSVSNTQLVTMERFSASAYVPEARELRIYEDGDKDYEWGSWGGDTLNEHDFCFVNSGEYTLTLAARFVDRWDDWDDWQDIQTITFNVTAENGLYDVSNIEVPVQIAAGEDLTIDFSSLDVQEYSFYIWKDRSGWNWGRHDSGASLTLSGDMLEPGIYHYTLILFGYNHERTNLEGSFIVSDEQDDGITLTLTSDGQQTGGVFTVQAGERFHITADAPGADEVFVDIFTWSDWYSNNRSHMEIDEDVRRAGTYIVYAQARYGDDWGPFTAPQTIVVTAEGQADVPAIGGVPEEANWGDSFTVSVDEGEHTAWYDVRVKRADEGEELFYHHIDGSGSCTINTSEFDPGEYRVEVYIAGQVGYSENCEDVYFTIKGFGRCEKAVPELLIGDTPLTRGDFLPVRFDAVEGVSWYHLRIYDEDWNEYFFFSCDEAGEYLLPTSSLDPNREYFVTISTGAPGYYWNQSDSDQAQRFTVSENDAPFMNFSKYDVLVEEEFFNSLSVPGAEEITATINEPENWNGDWRNVDQFGPFDGDSTQGTGLRFDRSGNYTLKLYARFKGQDWQYAGVTKTIHVTAAYTYDYEYVRGMVPATLEAGEDLVIYMPEGIDGSRCAVWDDTNWGNHVYEMNTNDGEVARLHDVDDASMVGENYWLYVDREGTTIHIPAEYLKAGHVYRLNMHYWGPGAEVDAVNDIRFVVTTGSDENVTIMVNGSTADQSFPLCQGYRVHVTAPGACAIRAYNGHNWDYRTGDDVWYDWDDGEDGNHVLFAEACYENRNWDNFDWGNWDWNHCDLTWSGTSNSITLTHYAYDNAQLPEPEFDLVNDPVVWGEYLEIRLYNYDEEAHYNASAFWRDGDGDEHWIDGWYDQQGDTILVPSAQLISGECYVDVNCGGKVGYYGNGSRRAFTVVAVGGLHVSSTEVATLEELQISVYDPDASRIRFSSGYNEWWDEDGWETNRWTGTCSWPYPDSQIVVKAEGLHGKRWVEIGRVTVCVSAPNGEIGEAAIHAGDYQNVSSGLNFGVDMPYGWDNYDVEVWEWLENGEKNWYLREYNVRQTGQYHVDGLEADKTYVVFVRAKGIGYHPTEVSKEVTMTGGNAFYLSRTSAMCGNEVIAYVYADAGAEEIHVMRKHNGEIVEEDNHMGSSFVWYGADSWGPGDFTVEAEARYGNKWVAVGSPIGLHVESAGQLTAPELNCDSRILLNGESLTVTFGAAENVGWYKVIISTDNGWILNYDFDEPGTYTLEQYMFDKGMSLQAGKVYSVDVSVWQEDYEAGWSNVISFAVVDSGKTLTLNMPAALTAIEAEAFAGTPAQLVVINTTHDINIDSEAFSGSNVIAIRVPEGISLNGDFGDQVVVETH